jgi:DNA-binding transcriptional ArsR family regulator
MAGAFWSWTEGEACLTRNAGFLGSVMPASLRKLSKGKLGDESKARLASEAEWLVRDRTRLQVVRLLANGEQHVSAICDSMGQSQPAISHHLALLRHAQLIAPRRQGKHNFYSLTDTGVALAKAAEALQPGRATTRRIVRPRAPLAAATESIRSASIGQINRRRAKLIFKENRGQLSVAEIAELESLQAASRSRMLRDYPAPTLIDAKVNRLEAKVRGGRTEKS